MASHGDFVTTDAGVRLFVLQMGHGADAVVIPNRVYLAEAFARLAESRTLVLFDPRNRGRSDRIEDETKLAGGIHHDVDDIEAIRRHYGLDRVNLIGHSYMAIVVALYAMKYPDRAQRIVQVGAPGPASSPEYPVDLKNTDGTLENALARLGELQKQRESYTATEFCKRFWAVLRTLYVFDPQDAGKLNWEPCDLPNEMNFMKQFTAHVWPSIQRLHLTSGDFARVTAPVLAVHGRQDRSSPYGGGREWVRKLPNARFVTIERAAHVPWIEDPDRVLGAIRSFLDGEWPHGAEEVTGPAGSAEAGV